MSAATSRKIDGWVILDKPLGLSSTQAMAKVRRAFAAKKAGHAGTLDPLATGVLPIALGEATKTIPFVENASKSYRFTLCWGVETTTDDREGTPLATSEVRPKRSDIEAMLGRFIGTIEQVPPVFSAIHIGGKRAYEWAREGHALAPPMRKVQVDSFALEVFDDPDHAEFTVVCGKGTYIRALARDLGRALESRAHVTALRRLHVGPFRLDKALPLDHIARADQGLHPVQTALDDIPALAITGSEASRLVQGLPVQPGERATHLSLGIAKAMSPTGLVALVQFDGEFARPIRVFHLET